MKPAIIRRKPGPWIEAIQFTGDNADEIAAFIGEAWKRGDGSVHGRLYFWRATATLKIDPEDWVTRDQAGVLLVHFPADIAADYERPEQNGGENGG